MLVWLNLHYYVSQFTVKTYCVLNSALSNITLPIILIRLKYSCITILMPLVILQFCHVTIIMIEFILVFMSMIYESSDLFWDLFK